MVLFKMAKLRHRFRRQKRTIEEDNSGKAVPLTSSHLDATRTRYFTNLADRLFSAHRDYVVESGHAAASLSVDDGRLQAYVHAGTTAWSGVFELMAYIDKPADPVEASEVPESGAVHPSPVILIAVRGIQFSQEAKDNKATIVRVDNSGVSYLRDVDLASSRLEDFRDDEGFRASRVGGFLLRLSSGIGDMVHRVTSPPEWLND